jgi:hypothetical protein
MSTASTETLTPVADARRYLPREAGFIPVMVSGGYYPTATFHFQLGLRDFRVTWSLLNKWDFAEASGYTPEEIQALMAQKRALYIEEAVLRQHFFA